MYWFKSAEVHRRIDLLGSIGRYDKSIVGYIEVARFGTAANISVAVAEIFEEARQWEQVRVNGRPLRYHSKNVAALTPSLPTMLSGVRRLSGMRSLLSTTSPKK